LIIKSWPKLVKKEKKVRPKKKEEEERRKRMPQVTAAKVTLQIAEREDAVWKEAMLLVSSYVGTQA
jgi:hypothetical protein